ncbi:MAG: putative hydroxymethylglutaryl-CoA synthase [Promethearchaeota archaeon]|nr:MAG: putative hydroxymethylglutaryl-CoA synthase [Candidatus Lokiarchaeota archaeon]
MSDIRKSDLFFDVGIDSFGFYTPANYVDLTELAEIRNVDPNKYLKGLLTKEMRIPGPGEDIVSMAVKACQYAFMKGNIDPKDIDAIFLGTETMTYAVKSVANILSEILDTSINCVTQDVYNACAGETLAILNAIGLINDGIINKALVIGADICSYKLKSPGEPTQGAAAAAVVISKNPRIAAFGKKFGKFSANVYDFYRLPHEDYPVVFGKYSIDSYIQFQMGALDDFFRQIDTSIIPDYLVFHSPFAKLPLKNLQNLLVERWEIMKKILLENFQEKDSPVKVQEEACEYLDDLLKPTIDKMQNEENLSNIEEIKNDLSKSITQKILPMLNVPISIGNMYSASVWSQLIYLLESIANVDDLIYFGSYGSGATCISGMLKVMPEFRDIVKKTPTVETFIHHKQRISIEDYESLREKSDSLEFNYAYIEPYTLNGNCFMKMNVCEEGCLVSKLQGLNFCPEGRTNVFQKNLPFYAVVTSNPLENVSDEELLTKDIVRVSQNTKKDQIVEINLLRMGMNESAHCIHNGYINWHPTYKPLTHPLK